MSGGNDRGCCVSLFSIGGGVKTSECTGKKLSTSSSSSIFTQGRDGINLKENIGLGLLNTKLYFTANQLRLTLDITAHSSKLTWLNAEIQELDLKPVNIIFIQDNKI